MMVKSEQEDLKRSLMSTITTVCSERLKAKGISQFNIEGLLAVTLEKDQVILVNVNENISPTPPPPTQPTITVQQQQHPPMVNGQQIVNGQSMVNSSQSVLCSIVSKAPLVVAPLQLTNGSQLSQSITLEDFTKTTLKPSETVKHKAATAETPPPAKKRLLEEHLTSHLDGLSVLEEVVIKEEVLSDDEDFASGSLTQQSLDPLIEEANVVNVAETDLAKMVRSDKMWNQHPIAQLTVAQAAAISTLGSSIPTSTNVRQQRAYSLPGNDSMDYDFNGIKEEDDEEDDDDDTSSYLNGTSSLDSSPSFVSPVTDEQEFLRLARSILLYKGTFITVHSFCKVSRRTGKNAMLKISSERACWVMQKMNVPAWDEKYIGEYKELRKGTKVFFKCPPDMVNPKALAYYAINLQTYRAGYYEECKSASFPTKTELLKRIFDASPY